MMTTFQKLVLVLAALALASFWLRPVLSRAPSGEGPGRFAVVSFQPIDSATFKFWRADTRTGSVQLCYLFAGPERDTFACSLAPTESMRKPK